MGLKPGDVIRLVAPSGRLSRARHAKRVVLYLIPNMDACCVGRVGDEGTQTWVTAFRVAMGRWRKTA